MNFLGMVTSSGIAGWVIISMACMALYIIIEKVKTFYFDFAMKEEIFITQVKSLVLSNQLDEAIVFCDANSKSPVAHIIKNILLRSERDEESIKNGMEIAFAEVLPKITAKTNYLAMISNVTTLVGLLGTIIGLIMSFSAVAFADPSQKQSLLSEGISVAMNTTAFGLIIAIPVMFIFSILNSKQEQILNSCVEYGSKMVDLVCNRVYEKEKVEHKAA